jgi:hypothetical protein
MDDELLMNNKQIARRAYISVEMDGVFSASHPVGALHATPISTKRRVGALHATPISTKRRVGALHATPLRAPPPPFNQQKTIKLINHYPFGSLKTLRYLNFLGTIKKNKTI